MSDNLIQINITNWTKYNLRNDRKSHSWFRLNNDYFLDPKMYHLSNYAKYLFIYLLCEASREANQSFLLNYLKCEVESKLTKKEISSCLEELCGVGVVSVSDWLPPAYQLPPTDSLHNKTRQDKTHTGDISADAETEFFDLVQIWNSNCGNLPKVSSLNKSRKAAIRSRLKENPSELYWTEVIKKMASSPFCTGGGSTGWRANFDFLLRPTTHLKVSEGAYDSKSGPARPDIDWDAYE